MGWKREIIGLNSDNVLVVGLSEDDGHRYAVIVTSGKEFNAPLGWYITRVLRLSGMLKIFMEQKK